MLNELSCNSTPFRCFYGGYMNSLFLISDNTYISRGPVPVRNSNRTFRMRESVASSLCKLSAQRQS